jgi:hypothetical protein
VGELYDVLGEENVCVLFVEESDTVEFWECLREFAQVSNSTSHSLVAVSRNRRNVRRTTGESWKISEFDPHYSAKVAVNKVFNLLWPHRKFAGVRETFRSWLVSATYLALKASGYALLIAPRQEAIWLTPEIENTVQQKVHDCNAKLASLVGRDLSEIGYL